MTTIARSQPDASGEATAADLRDRVAKTMARFQVPGTAVGLLHAGQISTFGLGTTNVDHPLHVQPDTLFQAGSLTKPVTATAVLRLVDQGRLDLDAPVRTYLPALRLADEDAARGLTLAHLLTHSTGWAELSVGKLVPPDTGPGDDALARVVPHVGELAQAHPPGSVWAYSNHGYALLGHVLERTTGTTYEDAVRALVLEPLGMTRSAFFAAEVITRRVAAGHWHRPGAPVVAQPWALARSAAPAGGLISTVGDLLAFARFHLGDGTGPGGERLLSESALAAMRTPRLPADWMADAVGLGWHLRGADGVQLVGHDGYVIGQQSMLLLVPAHALALVVLTNSDRGTEVAYEAASWVLATLLGLPRPPAFDRFLEVLRRMAGAG